MQVIKGIGQGISRGIRAAPATAWPLCPAVCRAASAVPIAKATGSGAKKMPATVKIDCRAGSFCHDGRMSSLHLCGGEARGWL